MVPLQYHGMDEKCFQTRMIKLIESVDLGIRSQVYCITVDYFLGIAFPVWILATDHETYSLAFSCMKVPSAGEPRAGEW